jgi:hypothetical protein
MATNRNSRGSDLELLGEAAKKARSEWHEMAFIVAEFVLLVVEPVLGKVHLLGVYTALDWSMKQYLGSLISD